MIRDISTLPWHWIKLRFMTNSNIQKTSMTFNFSAVLKPHLLNSSHTWNTESISSSPPWGENSCFQDSVSESMLTVTRPHPMSPHSKSKILHKIIQQEAWRYKSFLQMKRAGSKVTMTNGLGPYPGVKIIKTQYFYSRLLWSNVLIYSHSHTTS